MNRQIALAAAFGVAGTFAMAAGTALAGGVPHVGDVGVVFVNGKIVTTLVEEEEASRGIPPELGTSQRVFDSDLGGIEFGPFGNDEPGYTTNALPAGAQVGFNMLSELMRWNGSGFGGGIGETMQIGKFVGTPGEITATSAAGFVPGFYFATADAFGFFDEHLSNILMGLALRADPVDGIYLLELELFTDAPGIANSDPYWIVFNLNQPQEQQDEAIVWVEENLVPAPVSAMLAAIPLLTCLSRRRPRQ